MKLIDNLKLKKLRRDYVKQGKPKESDTGRAEAVDNGQYLPEGADKLRKQELLPPEPVISSGENIPKPKPKPGDSGGDSKSSGEPKRRGRPRKSLKWLKKKDNKNQEKSL